MIDRLTKTMAAAGRLALWSAFAAWTAMKALLFLAALAVVLPCIAIVAWFALWIGTSFFDPELSFSIGGWGRDVYQSFFWIQVCSLLLVVVIGCWLLRGALSATLRPETEDEKRNRFVNDNLIAQRNRQEDQAKWEQSMGYR